MAKVRDFEKGFLKFLHERHEGILEEIRKTGDLSDELTDKLKAATEDFGRNYFDKEYAKSPIRKGTRELE